MDTFEKQQTVEAVRAVIKSRWLFVLAIFLQGLLVKFVMKSTVPLPGVSTITYIIGGVLFINLLCWFYLRRTIEKLNDNLLIIIKVLQVPIDQIGLATALYFSGTVNKLLAMWFFVTYMIAASLYKRKGVALAAFFGIFLYESLVVLEYMGLIRPVVQGDSAFNIVVAGDAIWLRGQLIGFTCYSVSAAVVAIFLADLFRNREKVLQSQKKDLIEKTVELTKQTGELIETKNWLHDALAKSDKTRLELEIAKNELEKTNLTLQAKIQELQKFDEATTGREIKMMELKKEIKELRQKLGLIEQGGS